MSKFKPDFSLIKLWDESLNQTLPYKAPFVSEFKKASRSLRFIAARHEGNTQSPTLKTVRSEFDRFKPEVVILEGMPNTGETSPNWYLTHCLSQQEDNFKSGGEASYACTLAGKRNIKFVTGEPPLSELVTGIIGQGFELNDVIGWMIFCQLAQHSQAHDINEQSAENIAYQISHNVSKSSNKNIQPWNIGTFNTWYQSKMGKRFSVQDIDTESLSPSTNDDASFLQKVMNAADQIREPHILKVIAEQLSLHERVLVVYGAAHLGKQQHALSAMTSEPEHYKPY